MKDLNLKESPEFTKARLQHFLEELTILSDKCGLNIQGCGCCGSPWVFDIKNKKRFCNLFYGKKGYEVDDISPYCEGCPAHIDAADDVLEQVKKSDKNDNDMIIYDCNETKAMFMDDEAALADRADFVRNVGKLASQTREGVEFIEYIPESENETELAVIHYKGGAVKYINIRANSYSAIVRDIFKNL